MYNQNQKSNYSTYDVLDPNNIPMNNIDFPKTILVQHARIQKIASECLQDYLVDDSKLCQLYGAVYQMTMDLLPGARKEYEDEIEEFTNFEKDGKKLSLEEALRDQNNRETVFKTIMDWHRLNVGQYYRFGLKPEKRKGMKVVTLDDLENLALDVLEDSELAEDLRNVFEKHKKKTKVIEE